MNDWTYSANLALMVILWTSFAMGLTVYFAYQHERRNIRWSLPTKVLAYAFMLAGGLLLGLSVDHLLWAIAQ